jgi:diadenosine tetraphosphate (Ap4A) HIT family hydrolase
MVVPTATSEFRQGIHVKLSFAVERNRHAVALPDGFPVATGHMLVVRKHVRMIYELTIPEQKAISEPVGRVRERLLTGMRPDGFNIGFNDGPTAGQTVPHARIIPRLQGDVPDCRDRCWLQEI